MSLRRSRVMKSVAIVFAAALALPVAAFAQSSVAPSAAPTPSMPPMVQSQTGRMQVSHPGPNVENRAERHIAELYKKLHITDAQKPQWDAFVQAMRDNAHAM